MLNPNTNQRELAYVVQIDEIKPIINYDRVEYARTNGWWVIVKKGQFQVGDLAVYIEIDSKTPKEKPFDFLESKHYKIKTQKMCGVISQGLLMSFDDFGWSTDYHKLGDFVTSELGITYSVEEDNKRKSNGPDKYKAMAQRRPEIFSKNWARWMMKRDWGKKVMFAFFGKKKDNENRFPTRFQYIKPTDEERVENMPWILESKEPWVVTTKIDGTSATYILERKRHLFKDKYEFSVYSRNVRQADRDTKNYHNNIGAININVYWEMADKYHIEDVLFEFLNVMNSDYVALQGEIAGPTLQGNPHKLKERKFYGFNLINSIEGRLPSTDAALWAASRGIEWVPIINTNYKMREGLTMEEFKLEADGPCEVKGATGLREGYVYRSLDGQRSFKNVSRKYLLKKNE